MKRIFCVFMVAMLMLALCACGKLNGQGLEEKPVRKVPDNGKNAPSEEMIMEDISNALLHRNHYAAITGVETVKSLTNDGYYEITLNVTAESKYANWTYEADLCYTEYDQGWMMDEISWLSEGYTIERAPDASTVIDYLNNEVSPGYGIGKMLFPVESGTVEVVSLQGLGMVSFSWVGHVNEKHAAYDINVQSFWYYDAESDEWLLSFSDEENTIDDYAIYYFEDQINSIADFSGTWESNGNTVTISNFSLESFDVEIDGKIEHYERVLQEGGVVKYVGENHYFYFRFVDNKTTIMRSSFQDNFDYIIEVKEELPLLEN